MTTPHADHVTTYALPSPAAIRHRKHRPLWAVIVVLLSAALSGCGLAVPSDPDDTLVAASGDVLRVGVSADPGLVSTSGDGPSGPLADLATGFADSIDARPTWTIASEETLVTMLEDGDLDLAIGGFTDKTPWTDRAGVTRGYSHVSGASGRSIVMLVPLGENAFLTELERYLDEKVGS